MAKQILLFILDSGRPATIQMKSLISIILTN